MTVSQRPFSGASRPFFSPDRAQIWPVEIHGTACSMRRERAGYCVIAGDRRIAEAPTRFLAVARAASALRGDA